MASPEARSLVAAWGMHLDYAPDIAGGAVFPLLELFLDMQVGMHLAAGGASRLPEALRSMLESRGGTVSTGDAVTALDLDATGRVTGVRLASGARWVTSRGVIATLPISRVVTLLDPARTPEPMRSAADRFRYGPATVMVHLALSEQLPWADPRLREASYVHIGPYVDDMARAYQQAMAGLLPDEPLLVVGQTSVVDPSRIGDGGEHVVWVQARAFPHAVRGDAVGATQLTAWDDLREVVGDRVVAKLERIAPGTESAIRGRQVLTPADLEAGNRNLVGGDSISGSHHLDQFIGQRPSLGLAHYRTPVAGLYLAGAGSWPGGGVNATSGVLAAKALHADASGGVRSVVRRRRSRRGPKQ
jgi:phytoene dehydrogenase-like protein